MLNPQYRISCASFSRLLPDMKHRADRLTYLYIVHFVYTLNKERVSQIIIFINENITQKPVKLIFTD
jgi:hypothetical protein